MKCADLKMMGRPGFSLVEICIVAALTLLMLLLVSFFWRESTNNSQKLAERTSLEQSLQSLLLKLRQDLRSAVMVDVSDYELQIQLARLSPATGELATDTVVWKFAADKAAVSRQQSGVKDQIEFAPDNKDLIVYFKFFRLDKNLVRVIFSAKDRQIGSMILEREENIAFSPVEALQ
jgi:type II secretory pathway component PulJ